MKDKIIKYCFFIGYMVFEIIYALELIYPKLDAIIPDGLLGAILVLCFFVAFLLRLENFNKYIFIVFIIMIFEFSESAMVYGSKDFILKTLKSETSIIIFVMMLFFSTELDPKNRLQEFRIISYCLIFINFIKLLHGGYFDENLNFSYMGFGYGTVVYWTTITLFAFLENKKIDFLISFIVGFLMILLGNRGVVLIEIAVVSMLIIYYHKIYNKILFCVSLAMVAALLYIYNNEISMLFFNVAEILGFPSYVFDRAINNELFSDSGRYFIWEQIWDMILKNPVLGYGVGFDRLIVGTHTHNLILEIFLNYGIIRGVLFCIALIWMIFDLLVKNHNNQWRDLFFVYFIPSLIMLMFSNSIYYSRDFWIAISIFCAYKNSYRKSYVANNSKNKIIFDNIIK